MTQTTLIGPFAQILSMKDLPDRGPIKDEQLAIIKDAGIVVKEGKVIEVGPYNDLFLSSKSLNPQVIRIEEATVCLPGFIDVHTHLCFGGSRAGDYALRNAGESYLDIARAGGGIWSTVSETRKLSTEALTSGILNRVKRHISNGVTTIEIKSGYGLSVTEELKMLLAINDAKTKSDADLISTCLAAHILPKDYDGSASEYLNEISETLFPQLLQQQLCNRIDAFIEEEAFSAELIQPYFRKAKEMGFDLCVHADQFTPGASKVAVQFKAISADHLEASTETEIELLAQSHVIPVALPGASMGLGCNFAPARSLLDAGTSLVIASDWNPGSAPMGHLLTQACTLASFQKLSNAEVLAAMTCRAAPALSLSDRGQIKKGFLADFVCFPTDDYREILYQQGQLNPSQVWKSGQAIFNLNPHTS